MTIPQLKRLTESKEEIERAKSQFKERIRRIENKYKVNILIDLKSEVIIRK
jgi:hypothetical protein